MGIANLRKVTRMRLVSPNDLNHLIAVRGIVIRCSDVYPEMKICHFRCVKCGQEEIREIILGNVEEPINCPHCKTKHSFQIIHNLSNFTDKQYVKI